MAHAQISPTNALWKLDNGHVKGTHRLTDICHKGDESIEGRAHLLPHPKGNRMGSGALYD